MAHAVQSSCKLSAPVQVVVACRTDLDVTWSRWQIRVQPADTIQLSPNTEWKDKLDALKQQWQQNDPGRPDRAIATRSTFVNRDPSVDPPPMKDGTAIPPADHVLDPVDVQYSKDLETLSAAAKRNSEEIFQHWKVMMIALISNPDLSLMFIGE